MPHPLSIGRPQNILGHRLQLGDDYTSGHCFIRYWIQTLTNFPRSETQWICWFGTNIFPFPLYWRWRGQSVLLGSWLFHFPFSWIYLTKGFLKKFCYWNLYFFHLGWGISEHFQKGRILCTRVSCCNSSPLAVTLMFVNVLSSGLCTCCAYGDVGTATTHSVCV